MSLLSLRCVPLLMAAGIVGLIDDAPPATADSNLDIDDGSASDVVDDLKAQGYNVEINWTNGFDPKPCRSAG